MKKRAIQKPKPSEKSIEQTCTMLLQLDGWRAIKMETVERKEWGKGFGEPGMADHLYIRYGWFKGDRIVIRRVVVELLWIEFKRIRPGNKKATPTSPRQDIWHAAERARGAVTWIAGKDFPATIEGFAAHYDNSGLQRRTIKLGVELFNSWNPPTKGR